MSRLLLCTDLDRTLIPNGKQPESPGVRKLFSQFVARDEVQLAYVSGRHRALIEQAIHEYQLPVPDFVIADVGTSVYRIEHGTWQEWRAWSDKIGQDWQHRGVGDLCALLADIVSLTLQEAEKQNVHKLSYYLSLECDHRAIIANIKARLKKEGIHANIIWSVDELIKIGLLDIIPISANKLHAIQYIMQTFGYDIDHAVFAGDSGNDLDVMLSPIRSILVANADDDVRAAIAHASAQTLYVAQGNFLNMNGCYAAGILEGVAHYRPEFLSIIERLQSWSRQRCGQ